MEYVRPLRGEIIWGFLQLTNHIYHRAEASSGKVGAGQNDILHYYAKINLF